MRTALVLLALLALGGLALADPPVPESPPAAPAKPEAPAPVAKPAPPLTPEQAADAVLVAVKAKDDVVLKVLAAKDDPDPWLVADELIRRGEHDGAEAFAKAAPRVDVEKLPEYVESRRGKADDAGRRARLTAANAALAARRPDEVLAVLGPLEPGAVEDVVGIRFEMGRGIALALLARFGASAVAYRVAGDAAERIGWLTRACRALHTSGVSARNGQDLGAAREVWTRTLAVMERRGDGAGAAATLDDIGAAQYRQGEFASALATLDRALTARAALGDRKGKARALNNVALVHLSLGNHTKALSMMELALQASEELRDQEGAATALSNIGSVHHRLGDFEKALTTYERALAAQEGLGDRLGAATTLGNIGQVHRSLGDSPKARAVFERALVAKQALGDEVGAAATLHDIGLTEKDTGDLAKALATLERALAAMNALGTKAAAATALGNIGSVYSDLGDYRRALAAMQRAMEAKAELGDKVGAAATLSAIGGVHESLGDHARALVAYERALAAERALGDRAGEAWTMSGLGAVYYSIGDYAKALSTLERALAAQEALGNKRGAALALTRIGSIHSLLGDHAKGLSTLERGLAVQEALGAKGQVATSLQYIGTIHSRLGDFAKALSTLERARAAHESLGDGVAASSTLVEIGRLQHMCGDRAQGLATMEAALKEQEALGDELGVAGTLVPIGFAQLALGDHSKALAAARRSVKASARFVERLADEEGASARDQFAQAFDIGLAAAAMVGDAAQASWFLEQGRAGSLRAGLGSRQALAAAVIPDLLNEELLLARAAERKALDAFRKAAGGDDRARTSDARQALDAAQALVGDSEARIQREARGAAALTMGVVDELETLRARVAPDEALVLFGQTAQESFALVVRAGGARIVALGSAEAIDAAANALLEEVLDASAAPRGVGVVPRAPTESRGGSGIERLRALVVEPLALEGSVRRVLVSPTGALGFVPFALLLPDRETVYVPSGTTYGLLVEERGRRGVGVLALGDPDYVHGVSETSLALHRGGVALKLARLEASRSEVEAIGTLRLLQSDATEAGLRTAIAAAPRWRAVHLACHGLLDPERPMFSSLALTADAADDGFLSALEVFRMKVPADLVVMSACETGKGKVYKTEGIVGLTRAFMFAGAPRVICSLWKVNDAATKALMVKFYELWNPKDPAKAMGTAAALKAAQEYVRTYETEVPDVDASQREGRAATKRIRPWEHPYYWAAWVLWGLPS